MAMDKIGKLTGARGGELMYAVLSKSNQGSKNKRGSGGRGNGNGNRDGSKRPRQVREDKEKVTFKRRRRGEIGR